MQQEIQNYLNQNCVDPYALGSTNEDHWIAVMRLAGLEWINEEQGWQPVKK